jgi:threonine dehydratase
MTSPLTPDVRSEVLEAEDRIRLHIRRTPLEPSLWLGREAGCEVYLKLENLQITSSFKFRGALNRILSLGEDERRRGIVTASSGNHGSAVAYLLRKFGLTGSIYIPETASSAKVETLRAYNADLVVLGTDGLEAERAARKAAEKENRVYVSPYNDPKIIGGQGTIGLELESQLEGIDAVFCPVGGGGLAAGIAAYLKSSDAQVRFVGCQPRNSAIMYESVKAGHIVEQASQPTLADGTAGGIESQAMTFPICRDFVDEWVLVEEEELASAIRWTMARHHLLIEGAAALSIAGFRRLAKDYKGSRVVLIVSGARISLETLKAVLEFDPVGE